MKLPDYQTIIINDLIYSMIERIPGLRIKKEYSFKTTIGFDLIYYGKLIVVVLDRDYVRDQYMKNFNEIIKEIEEKIAL